MAEFNINQLRLKNQHLAGPQFTKPAEIVQWLGAVQAQDYGGAVWALGQRLKGGTAEIVVFNTLGSVEAMKPYTINKGIQQFSIDCNDWSSGLYYVRIKMNDTIKTERVVISNH